jgi:hypothetical protein
MVTTPVRVHDDVETPDDPQATIARLNKVIAQMQKNMESLGSKNTVPQA